MMLVTSNARHAARYVMLMGHCSGCVDICRDAGCSEDMIPGSVYW